VAGCCADFALHHSNGAHFVLMRIEFDFDRTLAERVPASLQELHFTAHYAACARQVAQRRWLAETR